MIEDGYIEEKMHEIWNESFHNLNDKIEAYFTKAIKKEFGDILKICDNVDVFEQEFDEVVDSVIMDFVESMNDNWDQLKMILMDMTDSFDNLSEYYEEEEEKWNSEEKGDIDLGLDNI